MRGLNTSDRIDWINRLQLVETLLIPQAQRMVCFLLTIFFLLTLGQGL